MLGLLEVPLRQPALSLVPSAPPTNRILAAVPPKEKAILEPHLEAVSLPLRRDLNETGKPIEHVYFLHWGSVRCFRRCRTA